MNFFFFFFFFFKAESRFNQCEIESWSLFFQFSPIAFLAILKATSIGVVSWLDVFISDESPSKHIYYL